MSVMDRLVGWSGDAGRPATDTLPATADRPPGGAGARPLEATWDTPGSAGGWRIRLPVRAEDIQVSKRTVVAERVLVQIRRLDDVARVTETVRREELDIEERAAGDSGLVSDSDETERWPPVGGARLP